MCKFCVGGCGLLIKDPPSNATVRVKIISLNGSLEALPARRERSPYRKPRDVLGPFQARGVRLWAAMPPVRSKALLVWGATRRLALG